MNEDLKKFLDDYENGRLIETKSNMHLIVMTIITIALGILALYLMISYHCF